MKKSVVFIVQQLSQPRCIKRIATIQNSGASVIVYGFDNGLYSDNLNNLPFKIKEIIQRDKSDSRLKKIKFFKSTIKRILQENKESSTFYFFGYEIATIAYILGCRNYIYEEADISAARIKSALFRNFLLCIDRHIIRKSLLTIFTSEGFIDFIFKNKTVPKQIILLPNKLNQYFDYSKKKAVVKKNIDIDNIKFGFIGLIRYPNTIIRFAKVVGKHFPQHEFHFYGDAERPEYIDNEVVSYKNIYFHGAFKNPIDLPAIYNNIDISVVCYDTTSGNVRIAEPNKLYESIFFETPIVVSSDTFLANKVKKYNAGDSIDASNDESIIQYIKSLNTEHLNQVSLTLSKVDYKILIDSPEELINSVNKIIL